jgi:mRNA-degrading endonuclease toxin of MazEF toxin-antitoxin module
VFLHKKNRDSFYAVLHKSRLKNKIAELSDDDMHSLETAMKRFLDLS